MSISDGLQIWLPLNGNTNNYGLAQGTINWTTSASFINNGKLKQSLSTGGCTIPASMTAQTLNNNAISIACWVYVNADAGDTTNRAMIFGNSDMSTLGGRQFSIFRYPSAEKIHLSWQSYDGSTYTTVLSTSGEAVLTPRAWNHVCVTYQKPNVSLYVNGIKTNSYTCNNMNTNSFSYDTNLIWNSTSHYLNDFRIYNRCISQTEVQQIINLVDKSGLILHLPLNNNGRGQINDNLFINTDFQTQYSLTSGWDTSINGTQQAAGWGGYNGGVPNPTTGYHAHLYQFNGEWVYRFVEDGSARWKGIVQNNIQDQLKPSTTYTFSVDQFKTGTTPNNLWGGLYYYVTGATSPSFGLGQFSGSAYANNTWERVTYTFTTPSNIDLTKTVGFYIYGHGANKNGTVYCRKPKLELGDIATPWTLSKYDVGSYDSLVYTEPDGSKWVRICCHNNPAGALFAQTDDFANGVYRSDGCWYAAETAFNRVNRYEFMVKQKPSSSDAETKYRWIQYKHPMLATWFDVQPTAVTQITTSGYSAESTSGGIYYRGDVARLTKANVTNGNWFGAFGSWTAYQGGTPGVSPYTVTSGYMFLYIRVDNAIEPFMEYDISGNGINGFRTKPLNFTSDTMKYKVSTHICDQNQKICIDRVPTPLCSDNYSFAWWAKVSDVYPMHWGFYNGIRLNGMYTGHLWNTGDSSDNPLYNIGTTTQVTEPPVDTWHHYVMTGNGSKCYVYLDGQLWAEAKTYKSISGSVIYINGWANNTDYSSNNMSISDFRIYNKALTAKEVLSLYNNEAYIDDDDVIHGQIR